MLRSLSISPRDRPSSRLRGDDDPNFMSDGYMQLNKNMLLKMVLPLEYVRTSQNMRISIGFV